MDSSQRLQILFVDDEPPVLNLLQTLFRHVSPEWESAFTDRGAKALTLMAERTFDVIVSDMRMPEMNGAELLEQVRDRYPRTARIVLSGYADQPLSLRALGAAHQYLAKPFTLATLQSALTRVFSLRRFVSHPTLQDALGRLHFLPTPPSLHQRFTHELSSITATNETFAGIVGQDVALTAKFLQIVNSAFFGTPKPVVLGKDAAVNLGTGLIRSMASANRLLHPVTEPVFSGLPLESFAKHSVATGLSAGRILTTERNSPDVARNGFTAGLLHDIGKLALATALPDHYAEVMRRVTAGEATLLQAEQDLLCTTHDLAGAYLLGLWGLPESIVETVGAHHSPAAHLARGFGPLTAVHVANHLEQASAGLPPAAVPPMDETYLRALRVDQNRLQSWARALQSE